MMSSNQIKTEVEMHVVMANVGEGNNKIQNSRVYVQSKIENNNC